MSLPSGVSIEKAEAMMAVISLDKLIEIIKLIKPEFYNKLTFLLVGSGVALASSPIWHDIVVATLQYFWPKIYSVLPTGGASIKAGIALIAMGLTYHLITTYLLKFLSDRNNSQNLSKKYDHDLQIYRSWDSILTENVVRGIISELENSHAIWSTQLSHINELVYFSESVGNHYMNQRLLNVSLRLTSLLDEIRIFISVDFDMYPYTQDMMNRYRLHLHPEWNEDLGGNFSVDQNQKYWSKAKELKLMTRDLRAVYDEYRKAIKDILAI